MPSSALPVLTVKCAHGFAISLDLAPQDYTALRGYAQELLLACPQCRYAARGFLRGED